MSLRIELAGKVDKIRRELLGLVEQSKEIERTIEGARHTLVGLRQSITITLDDLDRVDVEIRKIGRGSSGGAGPAPAAGAAP